MAERSVEQENPGLITITVRTPKEKHNVQVMEGASVREFKEQVHKKFNAPIEQLCIIFAGKIIKDDETLQQHGIKNGLTVHLVIKSANRTTPDESTNPTSSLPSSAPDISQTPFNLGGIGGLAGLSGLGVGSANFMEMQQRLQREMMSNPDTMRQLMDNPFIQSMMSNPEITRSLIMNNPQMRELMERNPEITHMLNNPELMQQTMELVRNPAMMQELMRSQDRAMSNLESIPGGFNALQRMYRDIQEPMISAAQETISANPFSSLVSNGSGGENTQQGRENTDPLPNPWGGPTRTTGSIRPSTQNLTTGVFSSPGMQSLMQQMMQNPQMMNNMLQAPYMQSVMQSLSSNPQLAQQVIANNPMFANDPQMQASLSGMMPTLLQQMQNPEVQNVVTNPRALEAMMQIQSGLNLLQEESPNLFSSLTGLRNVPATTTGVSASPTVSPSTAPLGPTTTSAGQLSNSQALSSLMAQMMAAGQQNLPPEQRYAPQLEQLATMGFVDREANIRALTATSGDVNAAIDALLNQR